LEFSILSISVLLFTFNHSPFLEESIAGIANQKLGDDLDVVWHDDCSTDDTVSKGIFLLEFHKIKYRLIARKRNRFVSAIPILLDMFELCAGEFIALLDGDDFWVSPEKLRVQREALALYRSVNLCFTRARTFNGHFGDKVYGDCGEFPACVSFGTVVEGDGGFMPTSSLLVRRSVLENAPAWFFSSLPMIDYPLQVLGSAVNGAMYLPFESTAYRVGHGGTWSSIVSENTSSELRFRKKFITLAATMRGYFPEDYCGHFNAIIKVHLFRVLQIGTIADLRECVSEAL